VLDAYLNQTITRKRDTLDKYGAITGSGKDEIVDPERLQPSPQRASSSSELNETVLVGVSGPPFELALIEGSSPSGPACSAARARAVHRAPAFVGLRRV